MNSTDQLDTFESALLTELRREVADHPAAVGLTAGGPTASPAFAVTSGADGST